jgi:L-threonylcarbamoyladenylate synthase
MDSRTLYPGMEMKTIVLPSSAVPSTLGTAVSLLHQGQAIAFPTDTVYGLGVDALNAEAVEAIYRIKGRPKAKAIPILVSGIEDLEQVAIEVPRVAYQMAEAFWPGALTIVVPCRPIIPDLVRAGGHTIAVRAPNHAFALDLLQETGIPIATSSANLAGEPPPTTADGVLLQLHHKIPLIVDGGPCPGGIPSTVIDVASHPARIVRLGAISVAELSAQVPGLELPSAEGDTT